MSTVYTLTFVNDCSASQTFQLNFGVISTMVTLGPGASQSFSANTNNAAQISTGPGQVAIYVFLPGEPTSQVVTFSPSDLCIPGTGPVPITILNNCPANTNITLVEYNSDATSVRSLTVYASTSAPPLGSTVTFHIRADSKAQVSWSGGDLFIDPASNAADRFLTLVPSGDLCALIRTPGTATTTVVNTCGRDIVATINEYDASGHLIITNNVIIPAGSSVAYVAQSIATVTVQVCIMGRCVSTSTSQASSTVTLTDRTGFCAPFVGTPPSCPVRCTARCR